ncbi:MAG TPA: pepsin/retropepsin-like aspartic protease family protein [Bacteroidales bacterium]|nr:pepsin/retropepsin-like aspartic protease family protein [Bacteroidales bacterium]
MNARICRILLLLLLLPWNMHQTPVTAGLPPDHRMPLPFAKMTLRALPIVAATGKFIGVTLPLKRVGRLFLLEGTIDNVVGNFILDTGASGLVLNQTYFRNAIPVADEEGGGVTGSTSGVSRLHVRSLAISDLEFKSIAADVIPLGHLENRRGVKILGLFGMSQLKDLEMVIDLAGNELQLYTLDRDGNRPHSEPAPIRYDVTQRIEVYRNVMFVKASIGGKLLDFCLDTGAESNVLNINAGKKVMGAVSITRRSGLSGSGQGRGEVLFGTLNEFVIGNRPLAPMETILCDLSDMARKYSFPIDGMLGYDFFMKGKVYINPVKKELGICLGKEVKQ